MNPEPPEPAPPSHTLTFNLETSQGKRTSFHTQMEEQAIPENGYWFRNESHHRIAMGTPGHDTLGNAKPTLHGLDYETASRLLTELALALSQTTPSNHGLLSIPE